jgi:hypothetical protein
MSETYEGLRDGATGEGAEAWRAADLATSKLYALYRELKEDVRFSEQHKAEKAWAAYEANKEKIQRGKQKAKELLEGQARSAERFSLPFPEGEGPTTADTSKLLASQNEAARVIRKLDRLQGSGKGPFTPDRMEVLRQEYGRGLAVGGVQGGAICRGVLDACDELGMDKHAIVEPFRKDRHRESLERAQHSERLAGLIGGEAPPPPFGKPGVSRGRGSEPRRGSGALLLPGRETLTAGSASRSGRRPPWK